MSRLTSLQILEQLISFDTTSRQSNLQLIDYVRNLLNDYGVDSTLVFNDAETCANLYTTIGPLDAGGVMLSGHTDVVPTTGQSWKSDPYQLKLCDELIFGRGSCDMKGFIACVLAILPEMVDKKLMTPIHLAFSYDEEIGCLGAKRLVERMKDFEVRPKVGVIGEPTSMNMVLGHKGKLSYQVDFIGNSCHSAYISDGVNAIEYAAELISYIRKMNQKMQDTRQLDAGYTVPWSTFHVGTIEGGTALNIVPKQCGFEFEIRNLPQQDLEELAHDIKHFARDILLKDMRERFEGSDIKFIETSHYPGLKTDPASSVIELTRTVNPVNQIGDNVSFGTEAGLFDGIGINSVICGPGSIDQAHKPDEFVSRHQIEICDQMMSNLVQHCRNTELI